MNAENAPPSAEVAGRVVRATPPGPGVWPLGLRDLIGGARHWRVSYLLGVGDVRRRYARSSVGQFWVTLTTALTIGALGFVWAKLWRAPVAEMMPYVAVSMIIWALMSGILSEAPSAFVSAAPIMHNQGMEFSAIIYGVMLKHLVILAHNLPIIALTFLYFGTSTGWSIIGALAGLAALMVFLTALAYLIAILCLRFRDLIQIVQNAVTVLFFVTPVLWRPDQLAQENGYLLKVNPFAVYLATIQKPLMGIWPASDELAIAFGLAIGMALLAIPVIGWARNRLIYWL